MEKRKNRRLIVGEYELHVSKPHETSLTSVQAGQHDIEPDVFETTHDRLHALRRNITLQREIAVKHLCDCRSDCHCRPDCDCIGVDRALESDHASETHESLTPSFDPPDHYLGHVLTSTTDSAGQSSQIPAPLTQLSGIGRVLDFNRRSSLLSTVTQANRLSQAIIINSSSISSLSLPDRRTYHGQAPSRPSWPPARPGPAEAIQRDELVQRHRASSTRHEREMNHELYRLSLSESMDGVSPTPTHIPREVNLPGSPNRSVGPVWGPLSVVVRGDGESLGGERSTRIEERRDHATSDQSPRSRRRAFDILSARSGRDFISFTGYRVAE